MDADRFEAALRLITTRTSRRLGLAALAAGLAGATRPAAAGKRRRCRTCPRRAVKLANGTCGKACTDADPVNVAGCQCGFANAEGKRVRIPVFSSCTDVPQTCDTTKDCPTGQHCQRTGCGASGSEKRCVAVCAA